MFWGAVLSLCQAMMQAGGAVLLSNRMNLNWIELMQADLLFGSVEAVRSQNRGCSICVTLEQIRIYREETAKKAATAR